WATREYTISDQIAHTTTQAENFIRSAMAPVISAGVITANIIWKATNTRGGMVCALPSGASLTRWFMAAKCKSPMILPLSILPKASEKPMTIQIVVTIEIVKKFIISM